MIQVIWKAHAKDTPFSRDNQMVMVLGLAALWQVYDKWTRCQSQITSFSRIMKNSEDPLKMLDIILVTDAGMTIFIKGLYHWAQCRGTGL